MRLAGPWSLLALAPAVLVAAGCGGDRAAITSTSTPGPSAVAAAPVALPAAHVPAADVDRVLGNSFRAGLQRLGVMQQPLDAAVDRGQPVPTGQLRGVACTPSASRPAAGARHWTCTVRWVTTYGRAQRTRYDVGLSDRGCLGAAAVPPRPQVRDNSEGVFAEDPLNALFGVGAGC